MTNLLLALFTIHLFASLCFGFIVARDCAKKYRTYDLRDVGIYTVVATFWPVFAIYAAFGGRS